MLPPPFFCLKSSFGLREGEIFTPNHNLLLAWGYPESLSQIQVGWIFSWFGVPPLFCLKLSFCWGGWKITAPIIIFYWSEVTLKVWAKSKLVKFLPNLGCPPLFLPKIKFWLRGGGIKFLPQMTIFYWSKIVLKVWANLSWLTLILGAPPYFCLKPNFGWGRGGIATINHNPQLAWGCPESFSKIWVGWIFSSFGVPPLFCLKLSFGLGGEVHLQSQSFIGLRLL